MSQLPVRAAALHIERPELSRGWLLRLALTWFLVTTLLPGTASLGLRAVNQWLYSPTPSVEPVDILAIGVDSTPVSVSVAGLPEARWHATADDVLRDDVLWRRMRLADWNAVPAPFREPGLEAMLRLYGHVIADPGMWDRMNAADWDRVPQPVRTVAFRRMVAYWCGFYAVGRDYGLAPRLVSDTVAAVLLSESWFDHRATAASGLGGRDIGLAQASPFARSRMLALYESGVVDARFETDDYFNPWAATRFAVLWTELLLDEAAGDLDIAVRAYHRGIKRASDDRGTAYLAAVHSRLERFIRNRAAPPAWDYVWQRGRVLYGV
jgi:hypothetical protein